MAREQGTLYISGMTLILASASARRRRILENLGVGFEVAIPDVEEVFLEADPRGTAVENAVRKHAWCRRRFTRAQPDGQSPARGGPPGAGEAYVIAADTVLDFMGRCVNKPRDLEEARAFFRRFSGRPHTVLTAVTFSGPGLGMELDVVASTVRFKELDEARIEGYFAEVDPLDKAGGYDIDQRPDLIIDSYTGSRTNIMGLPSETVERWLRLHPACAGAS